MMSYLASTSRTDILFAMHQCARFSLCPKRCHEEAAKRLGRYLKQTKEKVIVHVFDTTKGIEVCVHADFVGSRTLADTLDIRSAFSRTGYVIKVVKCPTCWVSKIQTEVALSKTEAEHIALSQSTRDLIPIKNLVECLNTFIKVNNKEITTYSILFKDNAGTLQLATEPKYRPEDKTHMC